MNKRLIGERIKKYRLAANMTQEQLAEKIDVSTSFLSRIETGISVAGFETYLRICDVLNVSLNDITQDVSLPAKRGICEDIFLNAIQNMNNKQLDYVLKMIKDFSAYTIEE